VILIQEPPFVHYRREVKKENLHCLLRSLAFLDCADSPRIYSVGGTNPVFYDFKLFIFASEPIFHSFSFDTVPLNKIAKRGSECRYRLNKM
jgi:hypothetical protein